MRHREIRPPVVPLIPPPKDQPTLFELDVPGPPVIAPEGVVDINFERSRRRFPEGA